MGDCLKNNQLNKQFLGLLSLLFFVFSSLFAQEKIEIKHADELNFSEKLGIKAQRLIGNVKFKHEDAIMYCDSAYYYSKVNKIDAFGSIRIVQGDTLNLYGDNLYYDGNSQVATVVGDTVRLISPDFILTTDKIVFDRSINLASYYTGGLIESKNDSNLLESQIGYFQTDQSLFTFRREVKLTNPEFTMLSDTLKYFTNTEMVNFLGPTTITGDSNLIYCENGWYDTQKDQSQYYSNAYMISDDRKLEGDTLYYDRNLGYGKVDGNVQITDTIENIIIEGQHAQLFEQKDSAVVTDRSLLTQVFDADSLFMHADTFKVYKTPQGEQFLFAYYGVRIYKSDLQGVCDSIAYSVTDSTIRLFNDPIMWSEENQMTADTIDIRLANSKINNLFLNKNAFIISEIDDRRYNQIKGKTMTGYFNKSKLRLIKVRGNGQTTYYGQDDAEKFIGVNVVECSDINILLSEGGIETITFIKKPHTITHPMGTLDPVTELRYPGFKWLIEKRPTNKSSLFIED